MTQRSKRVALFLGTALVTILTSLAATAAPNRPRPPSNICIGDSCNSAPSTANGIKWHPGHYVWLDPHTSQASQMAAIDALSAETSVKGVQLLVNWAALEGAQGDYSQGFAMVDAFLAKLGSLKVPKYLMLGVSERKFGTPPAAGTSCADAANGLLPSYVGSLSGGGCVIAAPGAAGSLAVVARVWDAAVMDRLIALSKAYAQRYDQNPLFEMFLGNGETAISAPPGSNYDSGAYAAQLKRWFDASMPVWPHTQIRLAANYFGADAQVLDLISYATQNGGVIVGGPDPELPLPDISRTVQVNQIFRAARGNGSDMRGLIPWVGEVQSMGLGDRYTQAPSDIYTYEANTMHASYMIWLQNTWAGGAAQKWSTGVLPFIQSIKGKVYSTACPPIYRQGCNTN